MILEKKFPSAIRAVGKGSLFLAVLGTFLVAGPALGQDGRKDTEQQKQESAAPGTGQDDPHAGHTMGSMNMVDMNSASMFLMNMASGTSTNAAAWPMPVVMNHFGSWNTMFMGVGFLVDTQQSGPRSGDKFYSPNWFMASTEHRVGTRGAFQADLMLSLDPATVTSERYPLLFQTGETAYGKAIVDGQHPHNFIMSLEFHYAYQLSENTTLSAYFAPVGDQPSGQSLFLTGLLQWNCLKQRSLITGRIRPTSPTRS